MIFFLSSYCRYKNFVWEPTPIGVEMDKYEKDVDDTLIDRKSKTEQKGKKA